MLTIPMPQAYSQKQLKELKIAKNQIIQPKKVAKKRKRRKRKKTTQKEPVKKCKFELTRIGLLMKYLARTEYDLLMEMSKSTGATLTPLLIEQVTYASDNPLFKSKTFRVALLDFRVNGLKPYKLDSTSEELRLIKLKLQERGLS